MLQARKDRPRSSVEDTIAHARSHGDAFRAQHSSGRRVDFGKSRPVKQVLAALDGAPSTSTGPRQVFRRHRGPRTTSPPKEMASGRLRPSRRRNPPLTTEIHCFTGTGASRSRPLESPPRAFAGCHPGDRPVITRRICGAPLPADHMFHLLSSRGSHLPRLLHEGEGCVPRTAPLREVTRGPEERRPHGCIPPSRCPPQLRGKPGHESGGLRRPAAARGYRDEDPPAGRWRPSFSKKLGGPQPAAAGVDSGSSLDTPPKTADSSSPPKTEKRYRILGRKHTGVAQGNPDPEQIGTLRRPWRKNTPRLQGVLTIPRQYSPCLGETTRSMQTLEFPRRSWYASSPY